MENQRALGTRLKVVLAFRADLEFGSVGLCEGKKTGEREKNLRSKDVNQQQAQPTATAGATLVGGEFSHHCAIQGYLESPPKHL